MSEAPEAAPGPAPDTAPDTATPVVGWRLWLLAGDPAEPELCSPAVPGVWRHRTAMTAACTRGCARSPARDCGCGLYATATPERLLAGFAEDGTVLGCVALWGRVVEADHGWRGEDGYPLVLLVSRPDPAEDYLSPSLAHARRVRRLVRAGGPAAYDDTALRTLGDRYGTPVRPVTGALASLRHDGSVTRTAAALRDEAAGGLAARRLGDVAARRRLVRAVEDVAAVLERRGQASPG
ncbi:hypothetical protein [Actinomycetospora flava]|uniref:Uncharacterized protein n=1 Tax=Actinomycetospora flava TaxID=3129232 RepID=A0ABU8LZY6_9PSEU